MVMVVPVDPDEREAEDEDDESGQEVVPNVGQRVPLRRPQLEGHDRDDHREDGVGERLQPLRAELRPTVPFRHPADDKSGSAERGAVDQEKNASIA
jgi:hypothetical protein